MNCWTSDARSFFLCGVRFFFGLWLLYGGLMKWIVFKPAGFIGMITGEFDKTWSPHALNVALGWLILVAEVVLPLFVLSGAKPRLAWSLMALLMFLLTVGQTIAMKDATSNWMFTVLTLVCAALSEPRAEKGAAPT